MKQFPNILFVSFFCTLLPVISSAGVELITSDMAVVSVSGKSCAGLTGAANCVSSLLKTGRAHLAHEELSDALESFQKASLLQPQNNEVIAAIMSVHLRTSDFDSAIVFLEGALKKIDNVKGQQDVSGALAYVQSLRSKKYEKDGKIAEAEADLISADALDPYSVQYLVALARLRHKAGSLVEAEKLLQKGLERFRFEPSRQEIITARDKMRQTEAILEKLRKSGG